MPVRFYGHTKRDPIKNYFPLPNEIFVLGLNAGEIAVYAYLLFCENRIRQRVYRNDLAVLHCQQGICRSLRQVCCRFILFQKIKHSHNCSILSVPTREMFLGRSMMQWHRLFPWSKAVYGRSRQTAAGGVLLQLPISVSYAFPPVTPACRRKTNFLRKTAAFPTGVPLPAPPVLSASTALHRHRSGT